MIFGTSAGAITGVQLALNLDLSVVAPQPKQSVIASKPSNALGQLMKVKFGASESSTPEILRQEMGRLALDAETVSEEESIRRVNFLAKHEWPANFCATAVNARTSESIVWHGGLGVPLELGVASSCALPSFWPPTRCNKIT